MSWRDRFSAIGSFRGAKFVVRSADGQPGRRTQVHEFPGRDEIEVEDLGLRKKEQSMEVFVSGDDYQTARDALIDAIDQPGPGELVNPYKGRLNVTITDARYRESTREGGMAIFTLSYVITPVTPVLDTQDTQAAVRSAADNCMVESINDFAATFDTLSQSADYVTDLIDEIDTTLEAVENVVTGVTNDITALIRAPFDMGVAIVGSYNKIKSTFESKLNILNIYSQSNTGLTASGVAALNANQTANDNIVPSASQVAASSYGVYTALFDAGNNSPTVSTTTPSGQRQADNINAVHAIVQQSAVASACLMSTDMQFDSMDDALVVRDNLLDAIDTQVYGLMSDDLYQAFAELRAAVVTDLRERGMQLPRLVSHTPQTELPALVIAHQLYGDATRSEEIVARNKIAHPGFVPGGYALEVLASAR